MIIPYYRILTNYLGRITDITSFLKQLILKETNHFGQIPFKQSFRSKFLVP